MGREVALPYPSEHELLSPQILAELEAWSQVSGWTRHHLRTVERFWHALGEPRPFRILEVGCALGGLLEEILTWAARLDLDVIVVGVECHPELVERAAERVGDAARVVEVDSLTQLGGPPAAYDLAIATLVLNQLSGPDRLRFIAEIGRVAGTAYLFDVTPSVEGEVGSLFLPILSRVGAAPPEAWVRTLKHAPDLDEVVRLVAPLPVQVARIFPAALATQPEPRQRVRIDKYAKEPIKVVFETPDLLPGTVTESG